MSNMEVELNAVRRHLKEHDGRFDKLEGRFDHLEGRFDHLEGRFDRLEERFSNMEMRFERMTSVMELLAEQMSGFFRENRDVRQRVEILEEREKLAEVRLRSLEKRR